MIAATERAIYEDMWQHPAYHAHSPGEAALPRFFRLTAAAPPSSVIDFGCGSGRASLALARAGYQVVATDHTSAGLEIMPLCEPGLTLRYVEHCLWRPWPADAAADFGFCCDVLEHVPTELTALTIARMLEACDLALYLEVSTEPDRMGVLAGQPLHKTVKPFTWWRDMCGELGRVEYGLDLLHRAVFVLR